MAGEQSGPILGQKPEIEARVQLPAALSNFIFPEPPAGNALVEAIRASLRMIDLGPDRITLPLYAAIWRAPLGFAPFSMFLVGETGSFKVNVRPSPFLTGMV